MAQSFVSYSATAAQTNFVVPFPFVAKANILVLVNGVQTAYTWLGATTVILAPTTAGDSVIVCRATDISSPAVTWTDPGTVTAGSLNLANLQELYALQEMTEANLLGATINAGWQPKTAVATASTANLVLSGEQIIDSVQTAISRVLVKDQTLSKDNGLYLTGPAAWTRTTDADTASKIGNALASVNGGTINGGSTWVCTLGATSITLGTTPLPFMKTGFQLGAAAPVAVLKGGTGASTATNARANLGISAAMDPVVTAATLPAGRTALGISAAMDPVVTAASLPAGRLAIGIPAAMDPVVTASSLAAARAVLGVSKSTSVNVQDSPFLAVGDGSADDRAAILAATTAAGANGEITFGAGTYKIAGNLTIPCAVRFAPGAKISVPTGITVTLSKAVTAGIYQIFSLVGTGQVALTASQVPVGYPEWWGAVTGGPDCLAAINAALVALPKTELQAADYWVSGTVLHATANHWLAGKGSTFDSLYGIGATRLLVTNGSSHCLQVGPVSQPAGSPPSQFPLGIRTTGISCARTVAPVATSGCDAIRVSYTLEAYFEDVRGDESMNGWEFVATVSNRLFNCKAKRSSAGTGGTDSWKGFYANGASPLFAGGNASLYIAYSHADDTRATVTNGSGFYFDGAFTDGFLSWCETVSCTTGINIQGNSATGLAFSNTDLHIKDCVNDVFKVYGILVTNIGEAGSVEIVGGYEGPAAGATAARCVNTSNASVNVVGGQLVMGVAPACLGIYVNASTGVRVSGTQILECGTTAVALAGASNCDIQPIIKNRAVTGGAAVQLSGTPLANYIKPTVLGKASGSSLGIQVVGVADARNEYNCSGIDSSCLAGGSAGKLNRNAVAITATGLSGTNLVSGVMT